MKLRLPLAAPLTILTAFLVVACVQPTRSQRTHQRAGTPGGSEYPGWPYGGSYGQANQDPYNLNGGSWSSPEPYPTFPSYSPPPSMTSSCIGGDAFSCATEAAMLPMVNQLRAEYRKSAMALHPKISAVARAWSVAQDASGNIGHSGFPSQRRSDYATRFGSVDVDILAENVAMNSYGASTPEEAAKTMFEQWRGSSGHLRNMLGNYQYIGIGIIRDGEDVWGTQIMGSDPN